MDDENAKSDGDLGDHGGSGDGRSDDDVLLDLGPQPRVKVPWLWIAVACWARSASALAPGLRTWSTVVVSLVFIGSTLSVIWNTASTPNRVTIHRDGQIVLHNRLITRRFPARALISVERVNLAGGYILEWGLHHRRTAVLDSTSELLRTLAQVNPDVAMLDMLSGRRR